MCLWYSVLSVMTSVNVNVPRPPRSEGYIPMLSENNNVCSGIL